MIEYATAKDVTIGQTIWHNDEARLVIDREDTGTTILLRLEPTGHGPGVTMVLAVDPATVFALR